MSEQYLFFCTNVGNENLLKEEVRVFLPELSLSYSRKGFVTFKNKGIQYDQASISQLEVAFSTRAGLCLGKARPEELKSELKDICLKNHIDLDKCSIHSFSVNSDYELDCSDIVDGPVNEYSPINKSVINLICLSDKEVWIGFHKVAKNTTHLPNSKADISIPDDSPSRAYQKIAETIEVFELQFTDKDKWLDFGSAPGGASYYLLERGCEVWGVDPAQVAAKILENKKYHHISKPVQDLSQEELARDPISWIHVDLNLNPKQSIKEVLRLAKKYNYCLKGIILTIQIIKIDHVKNIEKFEDHFYEWGFTDVISRQIPSHKKEYVVIAKR